MVLRWVVFFVLCGAVSDVALAQYFNYNKLWQQRRNELEIGLGATNYLGELGGANAIGSDFLKDFEISQSKFAISFMHRYFVRRSSALSYGFMYGRIAGDDQLTAEPYRRNRNIHFRSDLIEFSGRYEFHFLNEYPGHQYRMRGVKGLKPKGHGAYVYVGLAGFYFNPKAQYNGSWTALQPLGTEGQGLNGIDKYRRVGFALPIGFGYRYRINDTFRIGIEAGFRKTYTDYLDDTSTSYYDPDELYANYGEASEYLSNPTDNTFVLTHNVNPDWVTDGGKVFNPAFKGLQRGDETNLDSYLYLQLKGSMKIFQYSKYHRLRQLNGRYRRYGKKYKPKAKF